VQLTSSRGALSRRAVEEGEDRDGGQDGEQQPEIDRQRSVEERLPGIPRRHVDGITVKRRVLVAGLCRPGHDTRTRAGTPAPSGPWGAFYP
jgi:hypothetical protein